MLQRKPGVHRQQDAENSAQKITILHIVMRGCGIAHARTCNSRVAFPSAMERPTMLGSRLALGEYHEQIGSLCAVGNGAPGAGGQHHGPLRCWRVGSKSTRC